ncbi:hypothetical protein IQ22_04764, partial [Pseudomonas duriflava]
MCLFRQIEQAKRAAIQAQGMVVICPLLPLADGSYRYFISLNSQVT